jgi:hypothetical protein
VPKRRDSRPHHHNMPEVENAVWDDKMQVWVVRRVPRVRFG